MDVIEKHYYTINKIFLKILGIWPHNTSRFILLQRMLVSLIAVSYIIMQLGVLITTEFTMTLFVETMTFAIPPIIIVIKYYTVAFKSKTVKKLHHQIQEDWKTVRNKLESNIILKYAHNGQVCAEILFSFIIVLIVLMIIIQFLPTILDVILPLDEPRPHKLFIRVEYFVPQINQRYYYIRVFHQLVAIVLSASMMFATGTQLVVFSCHSLGMFKIASYRIENSIKDSILHLQNFEKKYAFCKALMHAVIAHRRAMQFTNVFISSFNISFCIITILGVFSLSICLYGFVEAAKVSRNMENLVVYFCGIISHLVYMFIATYIAQKFIDYNHDLFKLTSIFRYSISWYLMPISSQKLILFLMQKTSNDFYVTIGFVFIGKIESTATLMNAALSYVAVMFNCG